ncbi:hypothetical protein BY458DRAFT_543633 [Sporodiniella umbellata]|nr:hypothetical protein BY458DRAFT_543633 [Sporodiniella umbellata]
MSNEPYQWLPMPSGISLEHHSFGLDLLKQFNCEEKTEVDNLKKQQTSTELIEVLNDNSNIQHSIESIYIPHSLEDKRQRSAGDLIRKSSTFLKNTKWNEPLTWTPLKKKKPDLPPVDRTLPDAPTKKLSKVAINTTISIASSHPNQKKDIMEGVQPLVITHYPPKPLKYSPVEPISDMSSDYREKKSKTLHRLSIPILKITAALHQQEDSNNKMRRRSDSNIAYHTQDNSSSLSKKWGRFLTSWKNTLKKRKKEPSIHL